MLLMHFLMPLFLLITPEISPIGIDMLDPLEKHDLIQTAINKLIDAQSSALERYITEWFRASPEVNPADVALRVSYVNGSTQYQLEVVSK